MTTNLPLGAIFVAALLLQIVAVSERDYFSSVKRKLEWKSESHGHMVLRKVLKDGATESGSLNDSNIVRDASLDSCPLVKAVSQTILRHISFLG